MKLNQNFLQNILTSLVVSFVVVGFVWAFTGPGSNQPPSGDVTLTTIPSGSVMYTVSATCPTGWSEFTAARGRYIVGVPLGGTVSSTVGTALSNSENRAAGAHAHDITDPGHYHTTHGYSVPTSDGGGIAGGGNPVGGPTTDTKTTGITVNSTGTTAGTNAPYIQLIACQKS